MDNELSLGIFEFFGEEVELSCTYDPENLEIEDFIIFVGGRKLGNIKIEQVNLYDFLYEKFNTQETYDMIVEQIIEDHARTDFLDAHRVRRVA